MRTKPFQEEISSSRPVNLKDNNQSDSSLLDFGDGDLPSPLSKLIKVKEKSSDFLYSREEQGFNESNDNGRNAFWRKSKNRCGKINEIHSISKAVKRPSCPSTEGQQSNYSGHDEFENLSSTSDNIGSASTANAQCSADLSSDLELGLHFASFVHKSQNFVSEESTSRSNSKWLPKNELLKLSSAIVDHSHNYPCPSCSYFDEDETSKESHIIHNFSPGSKNSFIKKRQFFNDYETRHMRSLDFDGFNTSPECLSSGSCQPHKRVKYVSEDDFKLMGHKYSTTKIFSKLVSQLDSAYKAPLKLTSCRRSKILRLRCLGSGSYGTVYLEKDSDSGKLFACKQISLSSSSLKNFNSQTNVSNSSPAVTTSRVKEVGVLEKWARFFARRKTPITALREVWLSRKLHHKNIVSVHEILVDSSYFYIMMEYIPQTLHHFIRTFPTGVIPIVDIHQLAFDLFSGLQYLHSQVPAVIHRDLKPDNLLVSNGRLKICDFSLARECDNGLEMDLAQMSLSRGKLTPKMSTIRYSAPEILTNGTAYDLPSDVWAAGVIVAELLIGHRLFKGKSEMEVLDSILNITGVTAQFGISNLGVSVEDIQVTKENTVSSYLHLERVYSCQILDSVIEQILVVDPDNRITSDTAMSMLNLKAPLF